MTGHTNEVTVPHISPLALRLFSSVGLSPSDHRIIAWLAETALGLCCMRCGCRLIPPCSIWNRACAAGSAIRTEGSRVDQVG